MIHFRKKKLVLAALISIMLAWSPSAFGLDVNVNLNTSEANLDSCASASGALSASLGCDSDEVLDFTEYQGQLQGPDSTGYDAALTRNTNARDFIQTVVNYALSFLGLFAIIMVIYGGVLYVLSRGDADMATKGRQTITYAGVGILIILGSFAIVNTFLQAAGGGGASGTLGGGVNGQTVAEAGANFDVDDALFEIESIAADYVSAYQTWINVRREVAHMESIELPYILSLESETVGAQGLSDKISNALQQGIFATDGLDHFNSSTYQEIMDRSGLNDYIDEITESAQDVQITTDSLSDSYFVATEIYSYLRNNAAIDDSFIDDLLSTLSNVLIPSSLASNSYLDSFSDQYSPGSCKTLSNYGEYSGSQTVSSGLLSGTQYSASTEVLYDEVCRMIAALGIAADNDFESSIAELTDRMGKTSPITGSYTQGLLALFENDLQGGSSLVNIQTALTQARTEISSSATAVNVDTVQRVVEALDTAYNVIETIEFVNVVLDVTDTKGNAPMLVTFNSVGSTDPSGETIDASQIEWDLDGDGEFDDGLGYSSTFTYQEEGSYRVRVRISSQSSDVAAGIAEITINVNPRRSKIVFKVNEEVLADFRGDNRWAFVDVDNYRVTSSIAESGIRFDASESRGGNDEPLAYIEWDFGDGERLAEAWTGGAESTPSHSYVDGTYKVALTVTDQAGIEDRKYLTLHVGSPAARIEVNNKTGVPGDTFRFDAGASSTDVGSIVNYKWIITNDKGQNIPVSQNGRPSMEHTFDNPGVYSIKLEVTDSAGNSDEVTTQVIVESTPPIARFSCEMPNSSSPGTITCDGSESSDPDGDDIMHLWDFGADEGVDFEYIEGDRRDEVVTVRFLNPGTYAVTLSVVDDHPEELQKTGTYTQDLFMESVLEVNMAIIGDVAKSLGPDGTAQVQISGDTTGEALEIDCGNGETSLSNSLVSGAARFTCEYDVAGIYNVTMTAYDESGDSTKATRRVYIGTGEDPIAVIDVNGNGEDISFDGETVFGNIDTKFTFDATESVNVNGSKDSLSYSWNFGNGKTSSSKTVTTSFDEVAVYDVTLTVRDRKDDSVSSTASIKVDISPIAPEIRGLTAIPQGETLETPLKVTLDVDAIDADGDIEYIKAWYYNLEDTAEPLGTIIAQSDNISLTLNTNGEEGDEMSYGFAVEVTDSDNITVSSENELAIAEIPTLTVVNGPNDTPVASFSVDRTSVYIGEEITFINQSFDPDGEITQSWWDIGADGAYNDDPIDGATSLTYTFEQVHPEGIPVRLKVEDSAGATNFSDPITIYVDALSDPPEAQFHTTVNGATVEFMDNSIFDTINGAELQGIYWDFDLATDSSGNAVPSDDFDSFDPNPTWTYPELGTYEVQMTVVDTTGQVDTVTKTVQAIETNDPEADFSYTTSEKLVSFKNESKVDTDNNVEVRSYAWDFDLDYDSDGDGDPENDLDNSKKSPTIEFETYGNYNVRLTLEDSFGKVDVIDKLVEVEDPVQPISAVLSAIPSANGNNQVLLSGYEGDIIFEFAAEGGSGKYRYEFDKNIFYDTNRDGVRDNDADYTAVEEGTWVTRFFESYGTIVVKLTVTDQETGDTDEATVQVVFPGSVGGANLLNATPQTISIFILCALLSSIAGVALVAFKPNY